MQRLSVYQCFDFACIHMLVDFACVHMLVDFAFGHMLVDFACVHMLVDFACVHMLVDFASVPNCLKILITSLVHNPRRIGFSLHLFSTTHCNLNAYCAILVRLSNFRHQASPRMSPRESNQRRKVELWASNVR
jgi:hypothetical protein